MALSKGLLGMNARNFIYIRKYNKPSAKRVADNKLKTKELLLEHHIPTAKYLAIFHDRASIRSFDWNLPKHGFVIKPARGYGGEGILAFKNWNGVEGETISGKIYDIKKLESHLFDILDGAFSLQSLPDYAYIEELITPTAFFKKLYPRGLTDIRIIVFNKVPIMAMMRVPTDESDGKANLHLGALGIGIGIRTGITFRGIQKNNPVHFIPDTKIKVRGLKIPDWDQILLLAATTQSISGLGYAGIDIVVDARRGPLVLEINARPGLSIQIANNRSLRTRLERLEHMVIPTPERGIEVAKSLFAEPLLEDVDVSPKILSFIAPVTFEYDGTKIDVEAKLDTGAYRTSLDRKLVKQLGLTPLPRKILVKSASGEQLRQAVLVNFRLSGKSISTIATIATRTRLKYPVIIGRRDLNGFLINPVIAKEKEDKLQDESGDFDK